jgi:hypothetical protein
MTKPAEAVIVPAVEDMTDEVMYKHLNARHKKDLGLNADMHYSPTLSTTLINTHRAFHRRIHELIPFHNHQHEEQ